MSTAEEEERQASLVSEVSVSPKPSAVKLCHANINPKDAEEVTEPSDLIDSSSQQEFSSVGKNYSLIGDRTSNERFSSHNGEEKDCPPEPLELSKINGEEESVKREENLELEEKEVEEDNLIVKPTQIILTPEELNSISKEELIEKWKQQEYFINSLQTMLEATLQEVKDLKKSRVNDERLKSQLSEMQRKEQYHIMRLATKEHEIQELGAQIDELKNMTAGGNSLKQSLLDPAVNLLFERMKRDFDTTKAKMEETQNELAAWKFTPDSNTGKQLMAKCRLLIKENEELGKMISSGRLAKLEGDLALQRNFSDELKKSQSELEEFLQEMDEDTEGMQGTIVYLQSQLRQAKERISHLTNPLSLGANTSNNNTPASACEIAEFAEGSFSEMEHIHNEDSLQPYSDEGRTLLESSDRYLLKDTDHLDYESTLSTKPNGDLLANINSSSTTGSGECSRSSDGSNTHLKSFSNERKRTQSVLDESGNDIEGQSEVTQTQLPLNKRTRLDIEGGAGVEEGAGVPDQVVENGLSIK